MNKINAHTQNFEAIQDGYLLLLCYYYDCYYVSLLGD